MHINTMTVGFTHGLFVILGARGGQKSLFGRVTEKGNKVAAVVKYYGHGYQQLHY